MVLDLPKLPAGQPIADANGMPTMAFTVYWQQIIDAIEAHEVAQDQILADLQRTQADLAAAITSINIGLSFTIPSLVVSAVDDGGGTADITIAAHTRRYGDGTGLLVAGGSFLNKNLNTEYGIYYTDLTMANTTPIYKITTNLALAQNNYADGRHFVATIKTPAAGQPASSGGTVPPGTGGGTASGGAYTGGSGGGGVLV